MSNTGRPKKLPSDLYLHRVAVNVSPKQLEKLNRLCQELNVSYTEYFRSLLAKDKR